MDNPWWVQIGYAGDSSASVGIAEKPSVALEVTARNLKNGFLHPDFPTVPELPTSLQPSWQRLYGAVGALARIDCTAQLFAHHHGVF